MPSDNLGSFSFFRRVTATFINRLLFLNLTFNSLKSDGRIGKWPEKEFSD